jgi:hypothetical protein
MLALAVVVSVGLPVATAGFIHRYYPRHPAASSPVTTPAPSAQPTADPTPPATVPDEFAPYRTKPSYAGEIAKVELKPGVTYYLPNLVFLVHTGNDEWFIDSLAAPILRDPRDAGENPFRLVSLKRTAHGSYTDGSGLQITLPRRVDFSHYPGDPDWNKAIMPPIDDLRDPMWFHAAVIPITEVRPAAGRKLADYYLDNPRPSDLKVGETAYVYTEDLKQIAGTHRGYIDDSYVNRGKHPFIGMYSRITRTAHGFTACTALAEIKGFKVYIVPAGYVPMRHQLRVTFRC